jgi:hypothetical protein
MTKSKLTEAAITMALVAGLSGTAMPSVEPDVRSEPSITGIKIGDLLVDRSGATTVDANVTKVAGTFLDTNCPCNGSKC